MTTFARTLRTVAATLALPALLAALPAVAQPAPDTLSPEQLYRTLSPSVWVVRTYDADGLALSTGSAVVIAPDTLLTNCHVLAKSKRFVIRSDNVQYDARLQHIDVKRDLCQISVRNLRAPAVALGDSDTLSVGQKVVALGNPRGLELTLSDGLISALRRDNDARNLVLIQTSAPISPGSSGGGLFDVQGRLIGITTGLIKDSQNLNFAVPINWLRELPARSDAALAAAASAAATRPAGVATAPPTPGPDATPSPRPAGTPVEDVDAVPVSSHCKTEYRKYLEGRPPKAFAVATEGRCAWAQGRVSPRPQVTTAADPSVRALELCAFWHGANCSLYAVDSAVVYKRP